MILRTQALAIQRELERQERIEALHTLFRPEPGQTIMGKQIFSVGTRRNIFQFGRDSGKSFGGSYCMDRFAVTTPKTYSVAVFPERSQGQKILWDSGYLRDKIPQEYWFDGDYDKAFNKSELLIRLDNESYIQILGSDNPDSLRGIKPDFCNFDEMRDFKSDVYDIMEANLVGKILNILTTPPDTEGSYTEIVKMFKDEISLGNKNFFYLELPTYVASSRYAPGGPLHEELMGIKRRLIKRGETSKWLREYEAKFIPGGVGSVFKKYQGNKRHIERSASFLKAHLKGLTSKLSWFCVCDPSQNGTFAVLYIAVDRTAGIIYVLGEECVSDNADTGSLDMWARMKAGMRSHHPFPTRWHVIYDEAAAWFYNDLDRHGVFNRDDEPEVEPTHKSLIDKTDQMSLAKDIFASRGRIYISREGCPNFIQQIENYVTNKKGEYHKDQPDDFIDTFRYFLAGANFEPFEVPLEELQDELEDYSLEGRIKARESREKALTGEMDQYVSDENSDEDTDIPYDEPDF